MFTSPNTHLESRYTEAGAEITLIAAESKVGSFISVCLLHDLYNIDRLSAALKIVCAFFYSWQLKWANHLKKYWSDCFVPSPFLSPPSTFNQNACPGKYVSCVWRYAGCHISCCHSQLSRVWGSFWHSLKQQLTSTSDSIKSIMLSIKHHLEKTQSSLFYDSSPRYIITWQKASN